MEARIVGCSYLDHLSPEPWAGLLNPHVSRLELKLQSGMAEVVPRGELQQRPFAELQVA